MQIVVWTMLGIYVAMMIFIGIRSYKKTNSMTMFTVGGRQAGPWKSAFAYGATYFSAVIFIGYAGRSGWNYGLWAVLVGVGNMVLGTLLAWLVLGEKTRETTRRLNIKTMPQLFEKRYDSKAMKIYAAIIIFIFMTPYSASVYSGLGYLFESVLGIPYIYVMAGIAFIAAVYLVAGGYLASLTADLIQGIIMLCGTVAMVFFIVRAQEVGSLGDAFAKMGDKMREINLLGAGADTKELLIGLGGTILLTSFCAWGMPQMIHKFYGAASKDAIKKGTIICTVFSAVVSCGAYFIGSLSRLFFTESPENLDTIVPDMLRNNLPAILLGVVVTLLLAASVSTLSGITLSACSSISMDIIVSSSKKEIGKKKQLTLTRLLCLVFVIFSFVVASFKSPILTLMSFSWGTIAGSFLPPYILGLYWKGMNKIGAWSGMITALVVSLVLMISSGFDASQASFFGVLTTAIAFAVCIVVSLIANAVKGKEQLANPAFFDKSVVSEAE